MLHLNEGRYLGRLKRILQSSFIVTAVLVEIRHLHLGIARIVPAHKIRSKLLPDIREYLFFFFYIIVTDTILIHLTLFDVFQ